MHCLDGTKQQSSPHCHTTRKKIKWTHETRRSEAPLLSHTPFSYLASCTQISPHLALVKAVELAPMAVWVWDMQENGIGQDFALYYLAYATYLELRGNFSKADATFQTGLLR